MSINKDLHDQLSRIQCELNKMASLIDATNPIAEWAQEPMDPPGFRPPAPIPPMAPIPAPPSAIQVPALPTAPAAPKPMPLPPSPPVILKTDAVTGTPIHATPDWTIEAPQPKGKVAIVIGHSSRSQGAVNLSSGLTEFMFNEKLAINLKNLIYKLYPKINAVLVYRNSSYSRLPKTVNDTHADICLSLHCNAFNTRATGTEMLYFEGSKNGRKFASLLQDAVLDALDLPDRGVKSKGSEDRGGLLLEETFMPCVIVEPFFIDNDRELQHAMTKVTNLTTAYASAIADMLRVLNDA